MTVPGRVGEIGAAPAWRFGILAAAGAVGTSSVAPALNEIATGLSLGEAATAGVLSAYVVPYAACTIVAAQFCDAHGPRRVMRVALTLAVVGAVAAAAAPGAAVLLAARAVQGAGAGAVTIAAFDVSRRMPDGIARTAAVLTLGASSGPLLGGLAADLVGWQLAVLLPGLLHVTGLVVLEVPAVGGGDRREVDGPGMVATGTGAALGAAGLQLMRVATAAAIPLLVAGLGLLWWAGRRAVVAGGRVPPRAVIVDPRLRRKGALAASIAATYFSTLVVVPLALGRVGFSAIAIGLLLLPPAVTGAVAARRSPVITRRLGRSTDPLAAAATVAVLLAVLLLPPVAAALSLLALAAAYGVVQPPLLEAVSAAVHDGPATAIGAANLVLLLGGGAGSAVIGGLGATAGGSLLLVLVVAVAVVTVRAARRPPTSGRAGGGSPA